MWTLLPEVCCYLILAGLACIKLLRHRHVVVGLACGVWLLEMAIAWRGPANNVPHAFGPFTLTPALLFGLLTLTPVFLVGTLLYLYRDRVQDSGWLALGFLAVFAAGALLPFFGHGETRFTHYLPSSISVMAPALAYPLLWVGIHLPSPFQRVGARNDYSYGVYIYGWPVQQLLGIWGVQRWGYVVFTLSAMTGAMTFAVLSWHLVEKRSLRLKKVDPRTILTFSTRRLTHAQRHGDAVRGLTSPTRLHVSIGVTRAPPALRGRHHLHLDLGGLGPPGHGHRPGPLGAARRRLGARRPHRHRTCRRGARHGVRLFSTFCGSQ